MNPIDNEFRNPGVAYRGKPFWSWNGVLEEGELRRQVDVMQKMGLGGFFMHSRTGLVTEYLGEEWFRLTNVCADDAEARGLEAWLYDEDRWPSGTAGGMVTENPAHRLRFLSLRPVSGAEFAWSNDLVAAFTVTSLDGVNATGVRRIGPDTPSAEVAATTVLRFTIDECNPSSFYNGFTYVDSMSRPAIDDYIARTHEKYREHCGERLGKSIKGIFTDEPHRGPVMCGFSISNENALWMTPWTPKLFDEFQTRFGYDLVERLPDLFLIVDGRDVSPVKWHYMELTQQLFLENFARPLYEWCAGNDMLLTGHVLHEDSLTAQTCMQGSLMRFYEHMHYPGVDLLTEGNRCYWIVKQLTSAARQLGQKWLLSELYGCTGWQMDLQAHKAIGDWQALFGINLRCHHLSWYTMGGEAKRDYPASILHQSAWWREYDFVETYFARLGVVLTAGEPCCELLVINPVESVWAQVHAGWAHGLSSNVPDIAALENAYRDLFHYLAGAQIDFDYGDEEMIGRLSAVETDATGTPVLRVGQARYRTVLVPRLTTVRSSTLALLEQFVAAGGVVVFAGDPPAYVDAVPSAAAAALRSRTIAVPFQRTAIVEACAPSAACRVEIVDPETGASLENIFCQLRRDGDRQYLVAINVDAEKGVERASIRVHGAGAAEEWDCRHGDRYTVEVSRLPGGGIEFQTDFAASGERVYVLTDAPDTSLPMRFVAAPDTRRMVCPGPFPYTLDEPNVCVLDRARFRIGDGEWQSAREILKVDQAVRRAFDLPIRGGEMVQPWYRDKHFPTHQSRGAVTLAFGFSVDTLPSSDLHLALEQPGAFRITLNGAPISSTTTPGDWWVDTAFPRLPLPAALLRLGQNEITLEADFHEDINLEALYLLGEFGVRVNGSTAALTNLPATLEPGDLTAQGLPFYGGSVTFLLPRPSAPTGGERAFLLLPAFEAACAKVVSGPASGKLIAFPPHQVDVTENLRQSDTLALELILTRRNTFGPLHQIPLRAGAYGPGNFTTEGADFSDDYQLYPAGLLQAPEIAFALAAEG